MDAELAGRVRDFGVVRRALPCGCQPPDTMCAQHLQTVPLFEARILAGKRAARARTRAAGR